MKGDPLMGDEAGRAQLIEDHLPLVNHVVLQVAVRFPRYVDRNELARAGALGLVEAARRYDESRGVPFDRFAARRIRGAILDSVRAADWAPRSVRTLGRKLEQVEQELANKISAANVMHQVAEIPAAERIVAEILDDGASIGVGMRLFDLVIRKSRISLEKRADFVGPH